MNKYLLSAIYDLVANTEPTTRKTIENRKKKAVINYNNKHDDNIEEIRVHDFRHSHVSLLINNGIDSFLIAKRMDHSKAMVENKYGHLFKYKNQEVMDILNNIL